MAYGAILGQTPDLSNYATKNDLNDYLSLNGGIMNGSINMNNQKIVSVANGTNNNDVVNLGQLNEISNKINEITDFPNTGLTLLKRYSGIANSSSGIITLDSNYPSYNQNVFIEYKFMPSDTDVGCFIFYCFGCLSPNGRLRIIGASDLSIELDSYGELYSQGTSLRLTLNGLNSFYDIKLYTKN